MNELGVNVAVPDPLRPTAPRLVAPSWNVTVPVGVPLPGATTEILAVSVTDWLRMDGFADELTVVVVVAFPIVWFTPPPPAPAVLLEPKFPSPLY